MAFDEIIVLVISMTLSIGIVILFKKLLKDKFKSAFWALPVVTALGYAMMWFTSDSDTVLTMLKDVAIWTFIGFMFYVNFYCIVRGVKSRKEHGQNLLKDIKSEYQNVAGTFKKKKKENVMEENENDKQ